MKQLPARDVERDHHAVADGESGHCRPHRPHDAHRFVAEDVALRHERAEDLVEVEVGAAQPARRDLDDRVRRVLDRRIGDLVDADVAPAVPHGCLHRLPPAGSPGSPAGSSDRPSLPTPRRRQPRRMAAPGQRVGAVMRIVVTGATGNVGTSLVSLLGDDPAVDVVVGVARRRPTWFPPKVDWVQADVAVDDLEPIVDGADAVVHLSWLIQPARDPRAMWATNVVGTRRLADAVARTHVPALDRRELRRRLLPGGRRAGGGRVVADRRDAGVDLLVAEGARRAHPRRPRRAASGVPGGAGPPGADLQAGLGTPRPQPVRRSPGAARTAPGRGRGQGRRPPPAGVPGRPRP